MNESQQMTLRSWKLSLISYASMVVLVGLIFIDMRLAAYRPDLLSGVILFGGCLGFPSLVHRHLDASLNFWDGAKTLVIDWLIMFVAIWIATSMAWGFGGAGFVVFIVTLPLAAGLCQFFATKPPKKLDPDHIRGVRVYDATKGPEDTKERRNGLLSRIWPQSRKSEAKFREAQGVANAAPGKDQIRWSGENFPATVAIANFLVVGAQGTGKTLMHRELMHSVLATTRMLLIYDLKGDLVSQLYAWGLLPQDMLLLNPFDARAWAWDIAADLCNPLLAGDYANTFVPSDPEERQKYFTSGAQDILSGVFEALIRKRPGKWTLRDIINIVCSEKRLRQVLNSTPSTSIVIEQHFGRQDRLDDVLSTLSTFMGKLKNVATIWDRMPPERKQRLSDWCRHGREVLIMGNSADNVETLAIINRVMFDFIANRLTSGEEKVNTNRTWIFIDELQQAQRLDGLNKILTTGRSKGVRAVLGFQDLETLRDTYGTKLANGIIGRCLNQSFLATGSVETAQWASDRIGAEERKEHDPEPIAPSDNKSEHDTRRGEHTVARLGALTSQILLLPMSDDGTVEGYHIVAKHPDNRKRVRRSIMRYPFHDDPNGDNFHERKDMATLEFQRWSEDDASRLGLADSNDNRSYGPPSAADRPPDEGPDLDSFGRVDF